MFCTPNRLYGSGVSFSGGAWAASAPLANLADQRLAKVARSANALLASTICDVNVGQVYPVSAVGVFNHNLSLAAKVRLRGSRLADFSTLVYDSGWLDAWPTGQYPQSTLVFEDMRWWDGRATAEQRALFPRQLIHTPPTGQIVQYARFEFDDTANATGYVEFKAGVFSGWQPANNREWGSQLGVNDPSIIVESLGQVRYTEKRKKQRTQRFALDELGNDEAMIYALETMLATGRTEECLYLHDPADSVHLNRHSFLCYLERLNAIEAAYFQGNKTVFDVIEKVA